MPVETTGTDLTTGNVRRHLLRFATPLFIGNILQVSYGIVNRFWTGQFLGKDALGAVSLGFVIFFLILAFAWGMTLGASVLASQRYGAKDYEGVTRAVANAFAIVTAISLLSTLITILLTGTLLSWLATPKALFPLAWRYIVIGSIGIPFIFWFNLVSFFFRAIGDSKSPLRYLALSIGINMVLDPFLMLGWGFFPKMGVAGAALAMVISQGVAFVFSFLRLQRYGGCAALRFDLSILDFSVMKRIVKLGLPTSLQQVLVSVGVSVVQRLINGYGEDAIAAAGAEGNVDNLFFLPAMSLGLAVSAMVGQNVGAGKIDRARQTLHWALAISGLCSSVMTLLCLVCPAWLIRPFLQASDTKALAIGVDMLRIMAVPYFFVTAMVVFNGLFNGAGDTMASMFIALVSLWFIRIPMAWFLSHAIGINGVWWGISAGYIAGFLLAWGYYKSGRWLRKAAEAEGVTDA